MMNSDMRTAPIGSTKQRDWKAFWDIRAIAATMVVSCCGCQNFLIYYLPGLTLFSKGVGRPQCCSLQCTQRTIAKQRAEAEAEVICVFF